MAKAKNSQPPSIEVLPGVHRSGYAVKTFRKGCVDFHWHFHPELELTYIEVGHGVLHAGRSFIPYQSGDLFLLGSNQPHAYSSHPQERKGAIWSVMHLAPDRWGHSFWQLPPNHRIQNLFQHSTIGFRFRGEVALHNAALLRQLEKPSSKSVPLALCLELLENLARAEKKTALDPQRASSPDLPNIDPRLQQILEWIDNHVEQTSLSQAALARKINFSPQAFCRFFRQKTGRPFNRYVNELRIAHACSSLTHSTKSISEIAFHSGFNNLANFNRRFREITGHTPKRYRQMHRLPTTC